MLLDVLFEGREIGIGTIAIMPNDTEAYREDSFDNMKAFAAKHLLEKDGHIRVEAYAVRHGCIGVGARPRFLTILSPRPSDNRRTTMLCPTYQATRGSWLAPYATRVARRESGLLMRLFQVKPLDNPSINRGIRTEHVTPREMVK